MRHQSIVLKYSHGWSSIHTEAKTGLFWCTEQSVSTSRPALCCPQAASNQRLVQCELGAADARTMACRLEDYLADAAAFARTQWTQFNIPLMVAGLLMFAAAIGAQLAVLLVRVKALSQTNLHVVELTAQSAANFRVLIVLLLHGRLLAAVDCYAPLLL